LIDENRRRRDFVSQTLEHDGSLSEGLGYVGEQNADFLPQAKA
jgi:hypothetical protein